MSAHASLPLSLEQLWRQHGLALAVDFAPAHELLPAAPALLLPTPAGSVPRSPTLSASRRSFFRKTWINLGPPWSNPRPLPQAGSSRSAKRYTCREFDLDPLNKEAIIVSKSHCHLCTARTQGSCSRRSDAACLHPRHTAGTKLQVRYAALSPHHGKHAQCDICG